MNPRIAKFAEPPHVVAGRQEILGIKARALAQHAEINGNMRRFENGIAWFAVITFLAMAARVAWAYRHAVFG